MTIDPINDEILRIKRELAAQFGNDLEKIVADIKSRERNTITLPARKYDPQSMAPTTRQPKLVSSDVSAPTVP